MVQNLDQLYVLGSSALKTTCRDIWPIQCFESDVKTQINKGWSLPSRKFNMVINKSSNVVQKLLLSNPSIIHIFNVMNLVPLYQSFISLLFYILNELFHFMTLRLPEHNLTLPPRLNNRVSIAFDLFTGFYNSFHNLTRKNFSENIIYYVPSVSRKRLRETNNALIH